MQKLLYNDIHNFVIFLKKIRSVLSNNRKTWTEYIMSIDSVFILAR